MWEKAKKLRKSLRWKKKESPIIEQEVEESPTFAEKYPSKRNSKPKLSVQTKRVTRVNERILMNADVYSSIGSYLELESLLSFSAVSRLTKTATERIPLSIVLLRDIDKAFKFTNALPRTIIRLVVGKGSSYSTPVVVSYYSADEKNVMLAKLTALRGLIDLMHSSFEPARFMETMQNIFVTAIDVRNIVGLKAMLKNLNNKGVAFENEFLEECLSVASRNGHCEVITLLVSTIGFRRVNVDTLVNLCKQARAAGNIRVFATLLACICRCEPNIAAVNEIISNYLYSTAKDGQKELCIQLANMFQLRVRFKKLRVAKDRAAQGKRAKESQYSHINEDLEEERLREEEGDISEAMKVFKRSLQNVLQTACRNNHTHLARELLESKLATDVDEKIMFNFFKTAVGIGDEETAKWLITSRQIRLEKICEYFVNCARRNHQNSVRILLSTRVLPNPTLDYASKMSLKYGHEELAHEIQDYLV